MSHQLISRIRGIEVHKERVTQLVWPLGREHRKRRKRLTERDWVEGVRKAMIMRK